MSVAYQEDAPIELAGTRRPVPHRRYLALLIIPPLLGYLFGFFLVRMPGYERWGGSQFGPVLDYAFQTANQNADVVIFGDSSALFGVDPVQMGRDLHLKVVNLPNTIGGLPVIGDMALERYIARNHPPKMIIFFFCAWDLNYEGVTGTRLFEGEEMLARHGSWSKIAHYGLAHPQEVLYFPFRVYSTLGFSSLKHLFQTGGPTPIVAAFHGHIANYFTFPPLASDCTIPASDIAEHRAASVQALMAKYSTPQTTTMLYLAPVPGCQNARELLSAVRGNLHTAPPAVFPASDFTADGYYAHLRSGATPAATELAAAAVRPYLDPK